MTRTRTLRTDLIQEATESGFLITQEAVLALLELELEQDPPNPHDVLDFLLNDLDVSVVVIGISHVNDVITTHELARPNTPLKPVLKRSEVIR